MSPVQIRPPLPARSARAGRGPHRPSGRSPDPELQRHRTSATQNFSDTEFPATLSPAPGGGPCETKKVFDVAKATDVRPKITMACQVCKHRNYITKKNRRNDPDRLDLQKFCPNCGRHTDHRETR